MDNRQKKVRVAVLYGGKSGEHEVSLQSAASVLARLDRARFEVVPISIDKDGQWRAHDVSLIEGAKALPVFRNDPTVLMDLNARSMIPTSGVRGGSAAPKNFDVVFPVMHGPLYEDGAVQGMLELADVPYVGSGVLASAVGMDKEFAKRLVRDAGLAIVPFLTVHKTRYSSKKLADLRTQVERELGGYPVFVKPANAGSSVGVGKVKSADALSAALDEAFAYDGKALIEQAIDAREIEIAALENAEEGGETLVSIVGEIIPQHEFYSYEAKYLDENGALLKIPAEITAAQAAEAQAFARKAFEALGCEGMARVDLFMERTTGRLMFNEVNTIPGFTSISMYPKLWEASGVGYTDLLSKLVDLALAKHARRKALKTDFSQTGPLVPSR